MANIHVFADMDLIKGQYDPNPMQTIDEAFGPVRTNLTGKYRLTSRFQFDQEVTAYAAFDGIAIIQDVDGFPGLVNLALYSIGIGQRFPNPQIMVYRNLLREDFLTGTGVTSEVQVKNRPGFNSDLIVNMWDHFNEWKQLITQLGQTTTLTKPSYDLFGYMKYDANAANKRAPHGINDNVISVFLAKGRKENFVPFPIKKGWTIGRFSTYTQQAQIGGGIDILLEGNRYTFSFERLRMFQNIVEVTPGTTAGAESVGTMANRDQVTDYIDPAAFYNHYRDSGVDFGTQTYKGDDVYTHVVSKFYTKNRVYVEVRNQNDYSLNFYQDNMNQTTLTDHLRIGFNGTPGSESPVNYYVDFWPVYVTEVQKTSAGANSIQLSFRKQYNPRPVVYMDQAITPSKTAVGRFLYDTAASGATWSDTFQFDTPNIPGLVAQHGAGAKTSTAWVTRLYLIRKELPLAVLPTRTVPSNNYADLIFGPVTDLSSHYPTSGTMWILGGAKRYVNGEDEFNRGGDFMVQLGACIDSASITFFATLLDANSTLSPVPQLQKGKFQAADFGAKATGFAKALATWAKSDAVLLNFMIQPPGGGTKPVQTLKPEVLYFPDYGMLSLRMSRTEYENRLLPAANRLNSNNHRIYISLDSFQREEDDNAKYSRTALTTVSGINSSGVYAREVPDGGILFVRTIDRFNFTTENATADLEVFQATSDPLALFPANSTTNANNLIKFVEAVEEAYAGRDLTPEDTVQRLRHQFYGWHYKMRARGTVDVKLTQQGNIFALSIPSANNYETIHGHSQIRTLERSWARTAYPNNTDLITRYENAYDHLAALGDENTIFDNPSPFVEDPSHVGGPPVYRWDLGHAFYGFTSLLYGGVIDSVYDDKCGIDNSIYLASYIADISPPVANHFMQVLNNNEPAPEEAYFPESPDIDREWEISAPDADLLGDAEAFGWWAAWQKVRDDAQLAGQPFKFSDVLKRYYDPNTVHAEHYQHRWKLFCLHNNYIDSNGTWLVNGVSHPVYQDLINRVRTFAVFWCNIVESPKSTAWMLLEGPWAGDLETAKYNALTTDTVRVYYVIDRWLAKVQAWLNAE